MNGKEAENVDSDEQFADEELRLFGEAASRWVQECISNVDEPPSFREFVSTKTDFGSSRLTAAAKEFAGQTGFAVAGTIPSLLAAFWAYWLARNLNAEMFQKIAELISNLHIPTKSFAQAFSANLRRQGNNDFTFLGDSPALAADFYVQDSLSMEETLEVGNVPPVSMLSHGALPALLGERHRPKSSFLIRCLTLIDFDVEGFCREVERWPDIAAVSELLRILCHWRESQRLTKLVVSAAPTEDKNGNATSNLLAFIICSFLVEIVEARLPQRGIAEDREQISRTVQSVLDEFVERTDSARVLKAIGLTCMEHGKRVFAGQRGRIQMAILESLGASCERGGLTTVRLRKYFSEDRKNFLPFCDRNPYERFFSEGRYILLACVIGRQSKQKTSRIWAWFANAVRRRQSYWLHSLLNEFHEVSPWVFAALGWALCACQSPLLALRSLWVSLERQRWADTYLDRDDGLQASLLVIRTIKGALQLRASENHSWEAGAEICLELYSACRQFEVFETFDPPREMAASVFAFFPRFAVDPAEVTPAMIPNDVEARVLALIAVLKNGGTLRAWKPLLWKSEEQPAVDVEVLESWLQRNGQLRMTGEQLKYVRRALNMREGHDSPEPLHGTEVEKE